MTRTNRSPANPGRFKANLPTPILVSTDAEAVAAAAAHGAGVCFVPTFLAASAIARGELVSVLADRVVDHAPVHLLAPRPDRVPRRVEELIRYLRAGDNAV
jgi:DNA-binding transcriptional LysR family regulator